MHCHSRRLKMTCCPICKKPLPRCAICLLNLGTPTDVIGEAMAGQQEDSFGNTSKCNIYIYMYIHG